MMESIRRFSLSDPLREHEVLCYRCLFRGLNHTCLALNSSDNPQVEAAISSVPQFTNPFDNNASIPAQSIDRDSFSSQTSQRHRRSGGIFTRIHSGIQKLTAQPCMLSRDDTIESMSDESMWFDGPRKMSIWSEHSAFSEDSCISIESTTTVDEDDIPFKYPYHNSRHSFTEEISYEEAYDAVRGLVASPLNPNFRQEISAWSANTSEAGADDSSSYSIDSMTVSDHEEDWKPSELHLSGDSFVYNRAIQEVELRGFKNKVASFGEPEVAKAGSFTKKAIRDTFGGNRI